MSRWSANAQSDTQKISGTAMGDDVADSVVTARATTFSHPDVTDGQVQVVVNYDRLSRVDVIVVRYKVERTAAAIHKSHRLDQPDWCAVNDDPHQVSLQARVRLQLYLMLRSNLLNKTKATIMSGVPILVTGIAETEYCAG